MTAMWQELARAARTRMAVIFFATSDANMEHSETAVALQMQRQPYDWGSSVLLKSEAFSSALHLCYPGLN
jgi:hypothetical protein